MRQQCFIRKGDFNLIMWKHISLLSNPGLAVETIIFSRKIIPCKLVLAKNKYVASEFMDNLAFVFRGAMFQDMLDHIVAILILNQSFGMLM